MVRRHGRIQEAGTVFWGFGGWLSLPGETFTVRLSSQPRFFLSFKARRSVSLRPRALFLD